MYEPKFPPRTSFSLEDSLKEQKQEYAMSGAGQVRIYFDWNDQFERVTFDRPYYTALQGRGCILIYFSRQSFADQRIIEQVLGSSYPLMLYISAFLQGPYPILRNHVVFPDNPRDPLILESPLNLSDGNIQDFCSALLGDENIDIHFKHEDMTDGYYATAFRAAGAARVLEQELKQMLTAFKPTLSGAEFRSSVRLMESVFPTSGAGIDLDKGTELTFTGKAKTGSVQY